jgi:hypothetical protein
MGCGHLAIHSKWLVETKESEVAAGDIVPVGGAQFKEALASASSDLLQETIREFAQKIMDADVEVRYVRATGRSARTGQLRNGCRRREWGTREGTIELAIPMLCSLMRATRGCRPLLASRSLFPAPVLAVHRLQVCALAASRRRT